MNASLAAKVLASQHEAEEEGEAAAGKRAKKPASDLLADDRFKSLFEDRAFTIDEQSEEYKALHPNAGEPSSVKIFFHVQLPKSALP